MKKWMNPEIEELEIERTEKGVSFSSKFDDVRIDQYGNHWYSFSGEKADDPDKPIVDPI